MIDGNGRNFDASATIDEITAQLLANLRKDLPKEEKIDKEEEKATKRLVDEFKDLKELVEKLEKAGKLANEAMAEFTKGLEPLSVQMGDAAEGLFSFTTGLDQLGERIVDGLLPVVSAVQDMGAGLGNIGQQMVGQLVDVLNTKQNTALTAEEVARLLEPTIINIGTALEGSGLVHQLGQALTPPTPIGTGPVAIPPHLPGMRPPIATLLPGTTGGATGATPVAMPPPLPIPGRPVAKPLSLCECICACIEAQTKKLQAEFTKLSAAIKSSKGAWISSIVKSFIDLKGVFKNFMPSLKGTFSPLLNIFKRNVIKPGTQLGKPRGLFSPNEQIEKLGEAIFSSKPVEQFLSRVAIGENIKRAKKIPVIGGALEPFTDLLGTVADVLKHPLIQQLGYHKDVRQLAFETEGINQGQGIAQQQEGLEGYNIGLRETLLTNQSIEDIQKTQINNWRRGIREASTLNRVTVTGLNTARMLGASSDQTAELFADMHQNLQMSGADLTNMGRGLRDIARNTGITGDNLIQVAKSSQQFMMNMRNAGTLTPEAGLNLTGFMAEARTTGTTEGAQQISEVLHRSIIAEGGDEKTKNLLLMAAGNNARLQEALMNGTVAGNRELMGELAQGMRENVQSLFLGRNARTGQPNRLEDLSPEQRNVANISMMSAVGRGIGELPLIIQNLTNSSRTFADRMDDLNKAMPGAGRTQSQIDEQRQSLAFGATINYLGKFDTALAAATASGGDVNSALGTFNSTVGGAFTRDMQALGVATAGGAASTETMTALMQNAATDLNRRLTSANVSDETIQRAGLKRVGEADITAAIAAGPRAMQELIAQIQNLDRLASAQQKKNQDPVSRIESEVKNIQATLTQILNTILLGFGHSVDKIFAAVAAIQNGDWLAIDKIGQEITGWFQQGAEVLATFFTDLPKYISQMLENIKGTKLAEPLKRIWEALSPIIDSLGKLFDNLSKGNFEAAFNELGKIIALSTLKMVYVVEGVLLGALGDLIQNITKNTNTEFGRFMNSLGKYWSAIGDFAQGAITAVVGLFDGDNAKVQAGLDQMGIALGKALESAFEFLWRTLKDIPSFVNTLLENLKGKVPAVVFQPLVRVWQVLVPLIEALSRTFEGLFLLFGNDPAKQAEGWTKALTGAAEIALYALVGVVLSWFGALPAFFIGAIGSLVEQLGDIVEKDFGTVGKIIGAHITNLGQLFRTLGDFIQGVFNFISGLLSGDKNKMKDAASKMLVNFTGVMYSLVEFIGTILIDAVLGIITGMVALSVGLFDAVATFFKTGSFKEGFKDLGAWLRRNLGESAEMVENVLYRLWDRILFWFKWGYDVLVGHSIIPDLITGVINWFARLPLMILKILARLGQVIFKTFGSMLENLGDNVGGNTGGFIKNIGELFTNTGNFFDGIAKILGNLINSAGFQGFAAGWNQILDAILKIPDIGVRAFGNIGNILLNGIKGMGTNIIDIIFDILGGLGLGENTELRNTIKNAWISIMDWLIEKFNEAVTWAEGQLNALIPQIKDLINKSLSAGLQAIQEWWSGHEGSGGFWGELQNDLKTWWTGSGQAFVTDWASKALDALGNVFTTKMQDLAAYVKDAFIQMIRGTIEAIPDILFPAGARGKALALAEIGSGTQNVDALARDRAQATQAAEAEKAASNRRANQDLDDVIKELAAIEREDLYQREKQITMAREAEARAAARLAEVRETEAMAEKNKYGKPDWTQQLFQDIEKWAATQEDGDEWMRDLAEAGLNRGSIYTHDINLAKLLQEQRAEIQPIITKMLATTNPDEEALANQLLMEQDYAQSTEELEQIEENTAPVPDLLKQAVVILASIQKAMVGGGRRRGGAGSNEDITEEPYYNAPLNTTWEAAAYTDTLGIGVDIDRT